MYVCVCIHVFIFIYVMYVFIYILPHVILISGSSFFGSHRDPSENLIKIVPPLQKNANKHMYNILYSFLRESIDSLKLVHTPKGKIKNICNYVNCLVLHSGGVGHSILLSHLLLQSIINRVFSDQSEAFSTFTCHRLSIHISVLLLLNYSAVTFLWFWTKNFFKKFFSIF